jgi:hypothetical protein
MSRIAAPTATAPAIWKGWSVSEEGDGEYRAQERLEVHVKRCAAGADVAVALNQSRLPSAADARAPYRRALPR